jgi:hypothetical protein
MACDEKNQDGRAAGLEEAARLMDRWVADCDPTDYDDMVSASCYSHAAEQIRALKSAAPQPQENSR